MDTVIREGGLRLQTCEASCDVILSCQGRRLMAHKIILSIASPILRDLLLEDLQELPTVLIFPEICANTMSLILDYIYTGSVLVDSNNVREFISTATLLKVDVNFEMLDREFKCVDKKETDAGVYSKRNQKKMPELMPVIPVKQYEKKIIGGCFVPSPWMPRVVPVLSDPRTYLTTTIKNIQERNLQDPNNNSTNESNELANNLSFSNKLALKTSEQKPSDVDERDCKSDKETTKSRPFRCEDCGKCFSQMRNYKYHRSIHEGTKEFAAECHECGKTFNDRGYLSSHMKIHRDQKEYECPHCPKRFNQRVAYNMHLRIHTGLKPHQCPTCNKSFSRKMLLKQHQRVHTGERPYSCPECGKTFADRSNMSLHARLHTGVKPYACALCPKSFTKKHHLKTHMNFHTGLKPYTCEKCGLAFSQSSNMRTHYKKCLLKHTAENTDSNSSFNADTT